MSVSQSRINEKNSNQSLLIFNILGKIYHIQRNLFENDQKIFQWNPDWPGRVGGRLPRFSFKKWHRTDYSLSDNCYHQYFGDAQSGCHFVQRQARAVHVGDDLPGKFCPCDHSCYACDPQNK